MSLQSDLNQRPTPSAFAGFEPLTGNYVYCPNQFFDVCLANCSRGTVRIVAYVLRQTLGWLDKQGNPLQQEIAISYRDLIQKAGVSRGAIGPALKEAVDGGFITCSQKGSQRTVGQAGQSAAYRLRWDETGDPRSFRRRRGRLLHLRGSPPLGSSLARAHDAVAAHRFTIPEEAPPMASTINALITRSHESPSLRCVSSV